MKYDKELFYEPIADRYFVSSEYDIYTSIYLANLWIDGKGRVPLNTLYLYLELKETEYGSFCGWMAPILYKLHPKCIGGRRFKEVIFSPPPAPLPFNYTFRRNCKH